MRTFLGAVTEEISKVLLNHVFLWANCTCLSASVINKTEIIKKPVPKDVRIVEKRAKYATRYPRS